MVDGELLKVSDLSENEDSYEYVPSFYNDLDASMSKEVGINLKTMYMLFVNPSYQSLVQKKLAKCSLSIFSVRKKGSMTNEGMKEEEIEKGDCGPPTWTVLSDLNQAVPYHLAGKSQTR